MTRRLGRSLMLTLAWGRLCALAGFSLWCLAAMACTAEPAWAEEDGLAAGAEGAAPGPAGQERLAPVEEAAPPSSFVSTRNIEDKLEEARRRRTSLFNFGVRDASLRLEKRLYKATRIRFAGIYTFLYQEASTGRGPREAGGGDVDIVGTWDAVQRGGKTIGALDVAFEGRHKAWTEIPPASLSQTIDSLWTTTSGFNVQTFVPTQIYWRQALLRDRLRLRIGKVSAYSTFFGNRINSSSLFFTNFSFADNPAVFMPGNGLGVHASYDLSSNWTIHAGVQNANGRKTEFVPETLKFGEFWYAGQIDYRTNIRGLGEGTYRLGGWYVPARERARTEAGGGSVLSVDQELGPRVIGFLRYEIQGQSLLAPEVRREALTATRSALRFGLGLPGPFKRLPDDFMGLALAWGDPADVPVRDSYVAEYFYRFQLESAAQLSVSLQAIRSSTVFKDVFVLGLRMRIEF